MAAMARCSTMGWPIRSRRPRASAEMARYIQHGAPAHLQRIARDVNGDEESVCGVVRVASPSCRDSAGRRTKQLFVETRTEEPVARSVASAGLRPKQLFVETRTEEPVARSPVASAGGGDGEVQHGAPARLQRIARDVNGDEESVCGVVRVVSPSCGDSAGRRTEQLFVETRTEEPVEWHVAIAGLRSKKFFVETRTRTEEPVVIS